MGIRFNALLATPADNSQVFRDGPFMQISPHIVGTCLSAILATPVFAQQTLLEQLQSQGQSTSERPGLGATGEGAALPIPLPIQTPPSTTTITNRAGVRAEAPPVPSGSAADAQRKLQAEPRERNEFQDFVLQSTGRDLQIFGSNLFRNVPSIGPSDEIQIRAWGQIDVDLSARVEPNGTVSVPKVCVITVAGIRASDLPAYLKTVFGRTFRNFQLTATLGKLRSIQIYVVGQAKRPGTYTVGSLSTLVTAVFAAGGPSSKGTMRSIQLKRNNQVAADIDLYDLLLSGDKSKDARLLPGDVIYIPPVGPLVAVTGSVNVPAVYELKQS
ncbi:MAG: hypothetical protein E6H75_03665, partial [Betaproteobacteria bacterium]